MRSASKRFVAGALIAVTSTFVWAVCAFSWSGRQNRDWLLDAFFLALHAVVFSSWYVLPIGGVLGVRLPKIVRGCTRGSAFLRGALVGFCAGIVATGWTTLLFEWPRLFGHPPNRPWWQMVVYFSTMIPVCVLWVGVWACRWRRIAEPCAGGNAASPRASV